MKNHEQIIELIKGYNKKIDGGEVVDLDDFLNLFEVEQRIVFFKEFMREENSVLMKEELCNIVLNDDNFFGLDGECLKVAESYLNARHDMSPATLSKKKKVSLSDSVVEKEESLPESKVESDELSEFEKTMAFLQEIMKRDDAKKNADIFKKKMKGSCEETKSALCKMILEMPDIYKVDEDSFQIARSYLNSLADATPVFSRIEEAKQKFDSVMNSDDEKEKIKLCNETLERGEAYLNKRDWDRLVKFLIDDLNHKIISAMLRDKAKRDDFEKIMKSDDVYAKQRLAKAMLDGDLVIAPARQKWEGIADVLMGELTARIEKAESMRVSKGIAKSQMLSVVTQPVVVQQGGSVDDDNNDAAINNTPPAASEFFVIPAEQKQEALVLMEALRTKVYGEKVSHEGTKLGLDNDAVKGKPKFTGRRAPTRKTLAERIKSEVQVAEPAQHVEEVVVAPAAVVNPTRRRLDVRASMYVTNAERNRVMAAVQSEGATNSTNSAMATTSVPESVARLGFNMGINGSAALAAVTLRRTQQQAKQINN